jgi:tetratricopeptide (TPR) repeat protein
MLLALTFAGARGGDCGAKCQRDDCLRIAEAFEKDGDWDCALEHRKTEAVLFADVDAYYNLALAYEKAGHDEQALEIWQKAVSIAPDDQDIVQMLQQAKVRSTGEESVEDEASSSFFDSVQMKDEIEDMFAGWSWNGRVFDETGSDDRMWPPSFEQR